MGNTHITCGTCPHVRKFSLGGLYAACCGIDDQGLIVPHTSNGDGVISFHRVPEFCKSNDTTRNAEGYWHKPPVVVSVDEIETI